MEEGFEIGQGPPPCRRSSCQSRLFDIALRPELGYFPPVKAVVTQGFLEAVPDLIRAKVLLKTGMIMDCDETASALKATAVADENAEEAMTDDEFQQWIAESVGIAKGNLTTDEMMRETRGED